MKFQIFTLLLILTLLLGCGFPTSQQTQAVADSTQALTSQAQTTREQLLQTRTELQATTQPAVAGTQPSPTAIKVEAAAEKKVNQAIEVLDKSIPVMQAATVALQTAASGQNPGPAVTASAPLAGPYGVYVGLAGATISFLWGLFQNRKASTAIAANSTAVDAVQAAIAAGQLVVTSIHTANTVDSRANSSPSNDRLVDVIAAAPVSKVVTQ